MQAAGINPFRYIPADSHLAFLRDSAIYPHINRADSAHTIYPPAAQLIFLLITRIHASVTFMKLAWVGFEAVTCFFLLRIFKLLDLKPERVLIYAWHPLCLWEIASSGHIDAPTITFLTIAIYSRLKNQSGATGAWLGIGDPNQALPCRTLAGLLPKGKMAHAGHLRRHRRDRIRLLLQRRLRSLRLSPRLRPGRRPRFRNPLLPPHRSPTARCTPQFRCQPTSRSAPSS